MDEHKVLVDVEHGGRDLECNKVDINIHTPCPMTVAYALLFEISTVVDNKN